MLESKLEVGSFIHFSYPNTNSVAARGYPKFTTRQILNAELGNDPQLEFGDETTVNAGLFIRQRQYDMRIEVSRFLGRIGIGAKERGMVAGTDQNANKTHRNFQWLSWVPYVINEVQLNQRDVLTGPMSGCWIVVYKRNNIHYVGHIGTDANVKLNNATKQAWNDAVADRQVTLVSGFNPYNDYRGELAGLTQEGEDPPPLFFGLVTRDLTFHTIVLSSTRGNAPRKRIAAVEPIDSASEDTLRNLPLK